MDQLQSCEAQHDIDTSLQRERPDTAPRRIKRLLEALHQHTGQQVVVLVDEYDKPILDALDDRELAAKNRNTLGGLYSALKSSGRHIRFQLVTGITMFSKTSLFSVMNNLDNLSLDPNYSTICGYTEADLDAVFGDSLKGLDRGDIQRWHNGYNCWATNGSTIPMTSCTCLSRASSRRTGSTKEAHRRSCIGSCWSIGSHRWTSKT